MVTQNERGLKNRHIQMIALGGSVGTGLFLGAGGAIFAAGPSVILGYMIAGLISFLIIRQLADMVADEPVAGSFSYFAYKYCGNFAGFLTGWNYWILYVLVGIAELTACAAYMQYWFPNIPSWQFCLLFFILINIINMTAARVYGEVEYWFSIIKIVTLCAMIVVGFYIIVLQPSLVDGATFANLWEAPIIGPHAGDGAYSGFFPKGISGLVMALPIIMFAFGGLELIGITAAEADDPRRVIPKAANQVIVRILIFYIGTMSVLLSLYHWSNLDPNFSPFVMVFNQVGFKAAAGTINFVVLTASLSIYNSCVFATSRMLYGLAIQGNAPRIFLRTDKRGVPLWAMSLAGILTLLVVPLNYFVPAVHDAFFATMGIIVASLIINWAAITISHLRFRRQKRLEGGTTVFPAPWYPVSNYVTLAFFLFVLGAMALALKMANAVIAIPVWICIVYACYLLTTKTSVQRSTALREPVHQYSSD